ncbi:sugar transferase [Patescibacteria group bacterium]|nr:sugar transferase [Patescibacteria group bacterium]
MRKRHQHAKRTLLMIGDFLVFELSLVLSLAGRYGAIREGDLETHIFPFSLLFLLWMAGLYAAGLYNLMLLRNPLRIFRSFAEGMIGNLLVGLAFFYLVPGLGIAPRTNLFLIFTLSLLLGYAWRLCFLRLVDRRITTGRVLFVGPQEEAEEVNRLVEQSSLGFKLIAQFFPKPEEGPESMAAQIDHLIKEHQITTVVLGQPQDKTAGIDQLLYSLLLHSVTLIDRAEIEELTTGRIPLRFVTDRWFLTHLREGEKHWYESVKRYFDILLAIPFGLVTLILMPFLALAVRLSSPGPVFYSQMRVGYQGKLIRIWKLRTMRTDAEAQGPRFTSDTKSDPRITKIGRLLRQLRLDELPQIWNVFRGDLSFVGPRPERPEFVEPLIGKMPYYALRHLTRPGLTGWAQVVWLTPTASLDDNLLKLQYDLYYIKHRSFALDLAILLKTIGIVLRRQGT